MGEFSQQVLIRALEFDRTENRKFCRAHQPGMQAMRPLPAISLRYGGR